MKRTRLNTELKKYLDESPTPFHAVAGIKSRLLSKGYKELSEADSWTLEKGGKYFVTREETSIIAFKTGSMKFADLGIRMLGAHTDSPCLKVKPSAEKSFENYLTLNVDVYGGVILMTWFDRDLSIAGRVSGTDSKGQLHSRLINFEKPIALIPNLCIHLNRNVNTAHSVDKQNETSPLILQFADKDKSRSNFFRKLLLEQLRSEHSDCPIEKIHHFDLCLYDTNGANFVGYREEFLTSARLDNLLSCFCGLQALINAEDSLPSLLICSDHEEVGSRSHSGAAGPFLQDVLHRLCPDPEDYRRMIHNSLLLSADNAHGVHPNYSHVHDGDHIPLLNSGVVIKMNVNQRYASNDVTCSILECIAQKLKMPLQQYVNRSDLGCGSTIGPITATNLGVRTVDVGVPTFGMHSIRETAGSSDTTALFKLAQGFYDRIDNFKVS